MVSYGGYAFSRWFFQMVKIYFMQRRVTSGLKDSVEIMKEINLPVGENFIISGGNGKSKFWCQVMAGIFKKE